MDQCAETFNLLELAGDTLTVIDQILAKNVMPYEKSVQEWAKAKMLYLDQHNYGNSRLATVIEYCLVDILSCDNESWDTSISAFNEDSNQLRTLASDITGG